MEASKKYIEGFNSGYILRQYKPELAKTLVQNLEASNDYTQGLKDGNSAFEKEMDIEILRFTDEHKKNITREYLPKKGKDIEKGNGYDDL